MKLSFSTLGCPMYNIDQIIDMAVKNGYNGIELRAVEGTVDLWNLPAFKGDGLADTAKKLKDSGLEVSCIGTNIRFSKADAADKQGHLDTAKTYIELAKALDCKYLRAFGGPLILTQGYLESIEWIQDGYEALCDLTEKAGIMPLLETHDDFSASARVLDILGGVSSVNIGVLWDILHPYRYGEAVADTFAALKGKIRHVHIKDGTNLSPASLFSFNLVLTGTGDMPVGECVKLLNEDGYDGYFSYEWEKMWHPNIEEPEVAIPHYAEAMKKHR